MNAKQFLTEEFADGEWEELMEDLNMDISPSIISVMKKYAIECVKASLEKASRIAKTYKSGNSGSYFDASIDKLSITQESNITLL